MTLPWDDETARACGVTWLLAETAPAGAFGRAARALEAPLGPGDEARARRTIAACVEFATRAGGDVLAALRGDLAGIPDLAPAVRRARAGDTLLDGDLYEAMRFGIAVRALVATAGRRALDLDAALDPARFGFLADLAPGAQPGGGFYLADGFDAELAAARGAVEVARAKSDLERSRIEGIARDATGHEVLRSGEFVVMRDRIAGPLPPAIRVLREAPTYLLCEVALDDAALAALARLDEAERAAAAREDAVRARLSAAIARDGDAILAAIAALGELDVAVAKAAFAVRYETCVPEIADDLALDVTEACYLPLRGRARAYVPLDFALDPASVLTGPNMGGKTTALRTAGFVAACVALGLPVPAARARLSLFARLAWLAPGEVERPESGLSSFGVEIVRVRELLESAPARALVLIDEFARTTTPREGRALLVALIERLRASGALVFAATHASGVAALSGATAFAVAGLRGSFEYSRILPLDEALAVIADRMDYRIVRVDPDDAPASDAIALARALGLESGLADRAEAIARESAS